MPEDPTQANSSHPSNLPRQRKVNGSQTGDRSMIRRFWYRLVQWHFSTLLSAMSGLRVTGRENIPDQGSLMLVSNHLSHLDVLVLGILLERPLNYVARSTLFFWPLGTFIRSLGAFPIQRDGIGVQGLKETLKRLRAGGIVTLFPEGTRTRDGELAELKAGIALLAAKAKVPILPAAIAGTFESWPKSRGLPIPYPIRVHFGPPIPSEDVRSMSPEALTALIRGRILECQAIARRRLTGDLGPIVPGKKDSSSQGDPESGRYPGIGTVVAGS